MRYDNINLWFAKNNENKIITINEVDKEYKDTYKCPLCDSEVIAKQGDIMTWHFAHVDKSKCTSESMIHFWVKNKLLEIGDKFLIKTNEVLDFEVKEIHVEKQYEFDGKIYKPDITVITTNNEVIYFEIANTNKKKIQEYLDVWIGLGNIIVEVDSKDLINSSLDAKNEFNAIYYKGKCLNIKNRDDKKYYETIGEYKEKIIKRGVDIYSKNIIKKLDWLWSEISNYKKIYDIMEISASIDSLDYDAYNIVMNILKKPKCSKLYDDYILYEKENYIKIMDDFIEKTEEKYNKSIKISYDVGYKIRNLIIKSKLLDGEKWREIGFLNGEFLTYRRFLKDTEYIINMINSELNDMKKIQEQNKIIKNQSLLNVINKLNQKYEKTNSYYKIELQTNGYKVFVVVKFNNYWVFDINITNENIFKINNEYNIGFFLSQKTNEYRSNLKTIPKIDDILNLLKRIQNNLKKVNDIKIHYVRRNRIIYYKDKPSLYFSYSREDKISFGTYGLNKNIDFCIHGTVVELNNQKITNLSEVDIEEFKHTIINIISEHIR